ncbi:pyridoxal-phosphate dependent enzyme [Amylibacter sp.]|nr:pyridoxal-phosphate dependent enzyme [Amylibacter sp.]
MADYHLGCQGCNFVSEEDQYYVMCPTCGSMLEVILDNAIKDRVVDYSKPSIFKYHNFMPYSSDSDNFEFENYEDTPEFFDEAISDALGVEIIIKDEMVLPTHTWKDREGFISINRLMINNVNDLMVFSSGNTGTSIARSASMIKGPRLHLVIPSASKKRLSQVQEYYDPKYVICHYFDGSNDECIIEAKRIANEHGYVVEGGFSNYARREGLKLLGLEHIWNSDFKIDWYVQPVAGGIGVYSFDKACKDSGKETPRLLGVQAEICDPMVRAWRDNADNLESRHIPESVIPSDFVRVLRTRDPGHSYGVLKKIIDRCSGGFESVNDQQILEGLRLFYSSEYFRELYQRKEVLVGLEPATALAGVVKAVRNGMIKKDSKVLLNVSGAAKHGDVKPSWIEDLL